MVALNGNEDDEGCEARANCVIFFFKRVLNILKYERKEIERERSYMVIFRILLRFVVVASVVIVIIFGNIRYV